MPRIIIDENIPKDVIDWLLKEGFEVTSISQTPLKGTKDYSIAEYAAKNKMTILTMDKDFSQLYNFFKKDQITIIIVRAYPATPANIIEVLSAAQKRMNLKEAKDKLVVISRKKIRTIT